jgi:bcr-type benzoyl-CoA reductase subunit C
MKDNLKILQGLKERVSPATPPKAVREWHEKGRKVIGWVCNYIPEELIHAAGALPFRIIIPYETEIKEANAYLYPNICTYCRAAFQIALEEKLGFLDAIILGSTCDSGRRLGELWELYLNKPPLFFLSIPHQSTEEAIEFFTAELERLKGYLEEFMGIELKNESLANSIELYNKTRRLLNQLYQFRKQEPPLISGTEVMEILNGAVWIPREEFNDLLARLFPEIKNRPTDSKATYPRILINGTILNNSGLIECVEETGAWVVADELCTGYRYWIDEVLVVEKDNVIKSLAQRYLASPLCPRSINNSKRWDDIKAQIQDYRVDGVINQTIKYCAPHGYDAFQLSKELDKMGIPTLELNLEYGAPLTGQIKTRVQAFVEMLSTSKKNNGKERVIS